MTKYQHFAADIYEKLYKKIYYHIQIHVKGRVIFKM